MDTIWRTIKEAAEQIPRDERTIRRWCAKGGALHTVALRGEDGQWMIPQEWIDDWLAENAPIDKPETMPAIRDYTAGMEALRQEIGAAVQNEVAQLHRQLAAYVLTVTPF